MLRPTVSCLVGIFLVSGVQADELVYEPINPAFGGNPLNGNWMLNNAQAQDTFEDPDASTAADLGQRSEFSRFNDLLQRTILNRVASAATSQIIGDDGQLQPGTIYTSNFTIDVVDIGDGRLRITTTDNVTGESTSFEIDSSL